MMGPILLIILPFLGAFLLPIIYRHYNQAGYWAAPVVLVISLVICIGLWHGVNIVGPQSLVMGGVSAPLGIVFYVDALSILFVLVLLVGSLILWLGAWHRRIKEEMLLLLMVGGGSGLVLSGDLFNIYVFFEIVAVASYGLSASRRGDPCGYAASLRFLLLGSLGSAFILLGIAIIYALTGTLNLSHLAMLAPQALHGMAGLSAFALMLIGFAVKAELFPVNTWVAEVYAHAPVRISALLAGIVSKLAIIVVLRLLLLLYAHEQAYMLLLCIGVAGLITGELAAFYAKDLRRMLAYSSIGQLSVIAIAFSIPGTLGVVSGLALALHHALVKTGLFMLTEKWKGSISSLQGMAHSAKWPSVLLIIFALSLIGVPPLPGFWAKFLLFKAGFSAGGGYSYAMLLILLSIIIEAAYFFRVIHLLYQTPAASSTPLIPRNKELQPMLVISGLLLLVMLTIDPIYHHLSKIATQVVDVQAYIDHTLPAWKSTH